MTDVVAALFDLATIAPGDLQQQKKNKQFFFRSSMRQHRIYGGVTTTVERGKTTDRIAIIVDNHYV